MNKKIIWIVIGIVALFCAFFVRIYKTSPGFTMREEAEEFYRHVPQCQGISMVVMNDKTYSDHPEKSLCIGILTDTEKPSILVESKNPISPKEPKTSPPLSLYYSEFFGFPQSFFDGSILSQKQILKGIDAQYLSLKKMHNDIAPYQSVRIEYDSPVYGSTLSNGIKLGDTASPRLNSGHPRWAVMAHEQGHNFFGGTSAFYNTLAVPGPFFQESFAVLSALYAYNNILENQQTFGLDTLTISSLNYDFNNERNYQENQYNLYISSGKNFNMEDVLTSQALDYKMIVYGETYGWQNYRKLTKAFANGIASQFTFQNDGVSNNERSTYIIAALGAVFERDFKDDFRDLNFPIDNTLYMQIQPKIQNYIK